MSEYMGAKGQIIELFPKIEKVEDKLKALAKERGISYDDLVLLVENDYYELSDDNYAVISNRLFDISRAKAHYDPDYERYDIRKAGPGVYDIDLLYYNGGTYMEEIVAEFLYKEEKNA